MTINMTVNITVNITIINTTLNITINMTINTIITFLMFYSIHIVVGFDGTIIVPILLILPYEVCTTRTQCNKIELYPGSSCFCLSLRVRGTRSSMLDWVLDAGLSCTEGVWYIYDWDTG